MTKSLCSSVFAHSFHLRSFPFCVRLALLFFLHIPTRKIHRTGCDDVGIKTPATHFVAHKLKSLRPVCALCPVLSCVLCCVLKQPQISLTIPRTDTHERTRTHAHALTQNFEAADKKQFLKLK